jgi:PAS domain S-box-containing protein
LEPFERGGGAPFNRRDTQATDQPAPGGSLPAAQAPRSFLSAKGAEDHELLRMFVQHTPAAVAMLDCDMRYLLVSDRWLADYGLGDRELVGLRHYDVFPDIGDRWKEAHRRCLAGETVRAEEDSFARRDGRTEWLRWELVPWRAADGEIGGMLMLTEVITARKTAEQALQRSHEELEWRVSERTEALQAAKDEAERADALKSRFMAAASHDLRQPLQAAMAYVGVLAPKLSPAERTICESARQALDSMTEILDVLLDLSELATGAVRPQVRDFSVGELIERVLAGHRTQAETKGLTLRSEGPQCFARSDLRLVERVIDNLVSNAIRYTARGEVVVRCESGGDSLRVAVSDTGVGIPAEALDSVFEEYAQLDNPARDRRKGLGLGLSIVKQIATLLDLRIEVSSRPGSGSTFAIELPLGQPPATTSTTSPANTSARQRSRRPVVLFVEDNPVVAVSLEMALTEEGFDVQEAGAGEQAVDLVKGGLRPDVIVSDYRLPGYDGLEVVRRVRAAAHTQVPAVLVTGDTTLPAAELEALGDCRVLYKPVQPEQLAHVVASLADGDGMASA